MLLSKALGEARYASCCAGVLRVTQRSATRCFMPVHKAQPLHSIAPLPQMYPFPPTPHPVISFLNQPGRLLYRFFFFLFV